MPGVARIAASTNGIFTVVSGEIGISARAVGSGIAPILEEYALDKL